MTSTTAAAPAAKRMPKAAKLGIFAIGGLALFLMGIAGTSHVVTSSALDQKFDVQPVPLAVVPTPDLVQRGKELATFRGCRDCHGEDLAGRVVADAMPVMVLAAPNITPGGVTKNYTDEDWARTIRHGVRPDKTPLRFMPSFEWTELSHGDLAAIIAYAKSVPAKDAVATPFEVGPLGKVLYMAGELPLIPAELVDHTKKPAAPTRGPTKEYGQYLISACVGCHGQELSGGAIPGVPPDWPAAANLTTHETGLSKWTYDDFKGLLQTGKRPDGTDVQAQYMPWKLVGESASEDDIRALWAYLQSVPPKVAGGR